jgi:hypothetical protein
MKTFFIGVFIAIVSVVLLIALSYGLGWIGVHQKQTIGKAMQNTERKVFEETQSYVEGKRQEAVKLFKEYNTTSDPDAKYAICQVTSHTFANFNTDYLSVGTSLTYKDVTLENWDDGEIGFYVSEEDGFILAIDKLQQLIERNRRARP